MDLDRQVSFICPFCNKSATIPFSCHFDKIFPVARLRPDLQACYR